MIDQRDRYTRTAGYLYFAGLLVALLLTLLPSMSHGVIAETVLETARPEASQQQARIAASHDPSRAAYYIVRFAQYVHWPLENDLPHWVICVPKSLDTSPRDYADQTARGKSFEIREVDAPAQISGCQVLDLTLLDEQAAYGFLAQARKRPILTVGRGSAFCSSGGVICLERGKRYFSFEINLSATHEAGLLINARLLSMGKESTTTGGSP
ncbi:MAG: YfiR family protein [Rhodanobacter sp.]|nr:YfiR family protein [Rhodanobacter sp.]